MQEDGISWPRVSVRLRRWALSEPDVQRVTLGYNGRDYSIAVLLDSISSEGIRKVMGQVDNVRELFNENLVFAYPLGPNQAEALVLNSIDTHEVYKRMKH